MDRSRLIPRICLLATVGLSLIGVVVRTLAYLTCFDIQVGYFDPGPLPTVSNILFGVAFGAALLAALLIPKGTTAARPSTSVIKLPALAMGIVLALFTIAAFVLCYPIRTGDMLLAPIIFGLLGSTYYFVAALSSPAHPDGRFPDWMCALGFLPLLWTLAALAETYTDRYVAMNSPVKTSLHLALIGFLLIIITELRFRLGKPAPRIALCFLSTGVAFTLMGALPVLIATGAKVLADVPHTLYAAVLVFAGLYGAYLLISLVHTPATAETSEITANATVPQPCETGPEPQMQDD